MSGELHPQATITIKRNTGEFYRFSSLHVFTDGQKAGQLRRLQIGEFSVPAGEHFVAITVANRSAGPLRFRLDPGDRVELVCGSNQSALHPWHIHAVWIGLLYVTLDSIGSLVPAVRAFVREHLLAEVFIALAFGLIGMMIYFHRVHVSNAWWPALSLTMLPGE